jgi:putative ABC transport system ATP-binding protein
MSEGMIVRAEEVWKTFRTDGVKLDALKGVTLEIERGEFVCIMGPSGCGKSTLLHLVGCLDSATRGDILFEGRKISEMGEEERCRLRCSQIGFIFQTFNLLPTLNVLENVEMPARLSGVQREKRRQQAQELLTRVGLHDKSFSLPHTLSGGERQRVAIARALISNPQLVLADEPTGNLDSKNGDDVMELLREINRDGHAIIMVTHNPDTTTYSNRVVRMRDGKIMG